VRLAGVGFQGQYTAACPGFRGWFPSVAGEFEEARAEGPDVILQERAKRSRGTLRNAGSRCTGKRDACAAGSAGTPVYRINCVAYRKVPRPAVAGLRMTSECKNFQIQWLLFSAMVSAGDSEMRIPQLLARAGVASLNRCFPPKARIRTAERPDFWPMTLLTL